MLPPSVSLEQLAKIAEYINWPEEALEELPPLGVTDVEKNLLNHSVIDISTNSAEPYCYQNSCDVKVKVRCDGYDRYVKPRFDIAGYLYKETSIYNDHYEDQLFDDSLENINAAVIEWENEKRLECVSEEAKERLNYRYSDRRITRIPQPDENGNMSIIGCLLGFRDGCDRVDTLNDKIKILNDLRANIEGSTGMNLSDVLNAVADGAIIEETKLSLSADFGYRFNLHEKVYLSLYGGINYNKLKMEGEGFEYSDTYADYKLGTELDYFYADKISLHIKTEKYFNTLSLSPLENTYISEDLDYSVSLMNSYKFNKSIGVHFGATYTKYKNDLEESGLSIGLQARF